MVQENLQFILAWAGSLLTTRSQLTKKVETGETQLT